MEAKDYLDFAVSKEVKSLFKDFIETLEDIRRQHDSSFFKLLNTLPKEHQAQIIQASFFDEESYQHFRKIALDHGNDCIRSCSEEISKYKIDFQR